MVQENFEIYSHQMVKSRCLMNNNACQANMPAKQICHKSKYAWQVNTLGEQLTLLIIPMISNI